jgi:hypothetical protein
MFPAKEKLLHSLFWCCQNMMTDEDGLNQESRIEWNLSSWNQKYFTFDDVPFQFLEVLLSDCT